MSLAKKFDRRLKAALNLLGFECTRPRSPISPMPPEVVATLETVMRDVGLLET